MNTNPDRDTLRQRIAEVMALRHNGPASDGRGWFRDEEQRQALLADADAVLAVLPDPTDRAAVLLEAAEAVQSSDVEYNTEAAEAALKNGGPFTLIAYVQLAIGEHLRRLAAEAPTTTKPETGTCGHRSPDGHHCNRAPGHYGYHRHRQEDGDQWTSWVSELPAAGVRQDGAQP